MTNSGPFLLRRRWPRTHGTRKDLLLLKKYESAKESMDMALDFLEGVDNEEPEDSTEESLDLASVILGEGYEKSRKTPAIWQSWLKSSGSMQKLSLT